MVLVIIVKKKYMKKRKYKFIDYTRITITITIIKKKVNQN